MAKSLCPNQTVVVILVIMIANSTSGALVDDHSSVSRPSQEWSQIMPTIKPTKTLTALTSKLTPRIQSTTLLSSLTTTNSCATITTTESNSVLSSTNLQSSHSSSSSSFSLTTSVSSTITPTAVVMSATPPVNSSLPSGLIIFENEDDNFIDDFSVADKRRTIAGPPPPGVNASLNMSSLVSIPTRRDFDLSQVQIATQHMFYIRNEWSCGTPKPKLVRVLDFHASPSKAYVPRCTVLHRCGDDSGCCEDVTHRCEPSKSELIELYFHVIRSDIKNNITGGNAVGIEKLTFLNHTKCECRPINYQPRSLIKRPPMKLFVRNSTGTNGNRLTRYEKEYHHHQKCRHVIKCAKPFMHRFREVDQRCICDCISASISGGISADDHQKCVDVQLGADRLDSYGQRCVRSGECTEPICGFGLSFSAIDGKCSTQKSQPRITLQRLSGQQKSLPFHYHNNYSNSNKSIPTHPLRHHHHHSLHTPLQHQRSIPHHHHHNHSHSNNNTDSTLSQHT